jgi:hypothetical protein
VSVDASGIFWIHANYVNGTRAVLEGPIDRAMSSVPLVSNPVWRYRILVRGSMAEVYVNDVLVLPIPLWNTLTAGGLAG